MKEISFIFLWNLLEYEPFRLNIYILTVEDSYTILVDERLAR